MRHNDNSILNSSAIERRDDFIKYLNNYKDELEKAINKHYELIELIESDIIKINEILSEIEVEKK